MILEIILPEIPPSSISEHLFFKIFLGGMPPDPPSISMLCMLIVLCTIAKEHQFNYVPSYSLLIVLSDGLTTQKVGSYAPYLYYILYYCVAHLFAYNMTNL